MATVIAKAAKMAATRPSICQAFKRCRSLGEKLDGSGFMAVVGSVRVCIPLFKVEEPIG